MQHGNDAERQEVVCEYSEELKFYSAANLQD